MNGTLTGSPGIDAALRSILGLDDGQDDDDQEWAGITELIEIFPDRLDGVNGPASGIPALMAKAARRPVPTRVLKADTAKRVTMHVAYPVDAVDRGQAMDGARDFVKADALEAGAWNFMKSGARIGTDHADGTTGAGTCLETWIHRAPPWSMTAVDGSTQTVNPGDWCVLIQWSPAAWARFQKGDLNGVSMQGGAKRRRPPASALVGVRKAAKMPKCGKCQKRARSAGARFCTGCGRSFSTGKRAAGVAKSAPVIAPGELAKATRAAARVDRVISQARSADPAVRDPAVARLMDAYGPRVAAGVVAGDIGVASFAGQLVKAAARLGGAPEEAPEYGEDSVPADEVEKVRRYAEQAMARGPDAVKAMGRLIAMVGAAVAAKMLSGQEVSPGEFVRGYLQAGRANQAAAPGQAPRVPDTENAARAADFRRGPLGAGQSRPAPGSAWPGSGSQQDHYGGGPGTGPETAAAGRFVRGPAAAWSTPGLAASARVA